MAGSQRDLRGLRCWNLDRGETCLSHKLSGFSWVWVADGLAACGLCKVVLTMYRKRSIALKLIKVRNKNKKCKKCKFYIIKGADLVTTWGIWGKIWIWPVIISFTWGWRQNKHALVDAFVIGNGHAFFPILLNIYTCKHNLHCSVLKYQIFNWFQNFNSSYASTCQVKCLMQSQILVSQVLKFLN